MLKRIAAAAALAAVTAFAAPAGADETGELEGRLLHYCELNSGIAGHIMTVRQNGMPASEAMAHANKTKDPERRRWQQQVILDAYSQPEFTTEKVRAQQHREFVNKYYTACLDAALHVLNEKGE